MATLLAAGGVLISFGSGVLASDAYDRSRVVAVSIGAVTIAAGYFVLLAWAWARPTALALVAAGCPITVGALIGDDGSSVLGLSLAALG